MVGTPVEPSVAVDPNDPRHVVAAWQQDRARGGASLGAAIAVSRDGGATWSEQMVPGIARCAGGSYPLVTDAWVTVGSDHTAYACVLALATAGPLPSGLSVVVSASRDGGGTWGTPVVVAASRGSLLLDKPSILADPDRPGRVYSVWVRATGPADVVEFARSDDHGVTWSPPVALTDGTFIAQSNELLAPGGGTLLDVFAREAPPVARQAAVAVVRSTDRGQSWSAPATIAQFALTQAVDPGRGTSIRADGMDVAAAFGRGRAYVAWFEDHAGGPSAISVSGSADGGDTWSSPATIVQEAAEPFLPTIAVAGDGSLGATWYDLRDWAAGPGLGTEVLAATSADHGHTWQARVLDGPFDLRAAPSSTSGAFVGDYEGLAAGPSDFMAAYVRTTAAGAPNLTEVAFARFRQ
jgi:hypothetical protein